MEGNTFFAGTGGFILGILCGTLYVFPSAAIAGVLYVSGLCITARLLGSKPQFLVVGIFGMALCAGIFRAELAPQTLPKTFAPYVNVKTSFIGEVVADPDVRAANQQLTLRISLNGLQTNILLFAPLGHTYVYGEYLHIFGKLTYPKPFASENGRVFRYDHYLAKKHIFATMSYASVYEVHPPTGVVAYAANVLFDAKHIFSHGLRVALPDTYAALATGLLTGNQHQINENVLDILSVSGLVWVMVLSGYHVLVIAEAVIWLLAWLPKRIRLSLAVLCVMAVIFATGASAPSLRGGMMVALTLFARGTNRTYNSLRALACTVLVLLMWNPLLLAYDSGFQLSILVTPALILGTPIIESRLAWINYVYVREVLSVSIIAQLSILPLLLWQDGQLEPWAILSNVFAMPLVPVSMLCAVIAGFAGIFLPAFARLIGWPAHLVLYFILIIGQYTSRLPYATKALPPFSFCYVVIAYAFLIACMWKLKKEKRL